MEGHLLMSAKERRQLVAFGRVVSREWSLREACDCLGISYRQASRMLARFKADGDAGLAHRSRGKPSTNRAPDATKQAILDLYRDRYDGFGPTLAAEKISECEQIPVNHETLRLWLIAAGLWKPKRTRRSGHNPWRKRKNHFGELVQMDGSIHAWFEDRGETCFLMSMVDDATGKSRFLFSKEETTQAAMALLESWVRAYGIPAALYVDRKTVYVTDREPTVEEQLAGTGALTQFGRACQKLGIRIVEAHSPQAKGRVERKHQVCQDRLIKEMRLANICDIDVGNAFLPAWTAKLNAKFAIEPASPADMHAPLPADLDLRSVFCQEQTRSVGAEGTVRFNNRWYQILSRPHQRRPAARTKITVQLWNDGTVHVVLGTKELTITELAGPPPKPRPEPKASTHEGHRPADDHYWRGKTQLGPELRQMREEIEGLADNYLGPIR
jgi:hypothetical protein